MRLTKIRETAETLLSTLDTHEVRVIQEAQQNFSQAVEAAWHAYEQGKIQTPGNGRALPRMMYLYATRELPLEVTHLRRWSTVKREITNFLRMMDLVVGPSKKE